LQARRPGKLHRLSRLQLSEGVRPDGAGKRPLRQAIQTAEALTGGDPRLDQNGNASGTRGQGVKVGGDELDGKWLWHGTLQVWKWDRDD
jgi:hypothetical protein